MTLTGVESVLASSAGSVRAMEPDVDLAPTNVETGVSGAAVNFDGSTARAVPVTMSCPTSRQSVANATVNRLMNDLLTTRDLGDETGAQCAGAAGMWRSLRRGRQRINPILTSVAAAPGTSLAAARRRR